MLTAASTNSLTLWIDGFNVPSVSWTQPSSIEGEQRIGLRGRK